jgi:hypothetical protein
MRYAIQARGGHDQSFLSAQQARLAERAGLKIVLQRQLANLCVKRLQVHRDSAAEIADETLARKISGSNSIVTCEYQHDSLSRPTLM